MIERADAAAKLHRIFRGFQNGVDGLAIDGLTGEGTVEINDVQPLETLILKGFRLRAGSSL